MKTIFQNKRDLIEQMVPRGAKVLDVGFWGQGVTAHDLHWPHRLLKERTDTVWGLDIEFDDAALEPRGHYVRASAEDFSIPETFDLIFAGDLIEHLSNPGKFLDSARRHIVPNGKLVLTTPNAFNLFNIAEKFSKGEPTVNPDHTCYFNDKTLSVLLRKNGWRTESIAYVYSLELSHKESWKKKVLNAIYWGVSKVTPSFVETLVVVAVPADSRK